MHPRPDAIRSRLTDLAGALRRLHNKWRDYDIYVSALVIFAASRIVTIVGIHLGTMLVRIPDPKKMDFGDAWYHRLLRWDTGWYASIIREGYRYSGDPTVESSAVFHPLYPLVAQAVKSLAGVNEFMALLIVANVVAPIAVLLMTKFVRDELGNEIALWSVALFCFFPASLFLSAGYTESLCLVFILLGFILLKQQKFVLAATMAGLAVGTRSTGIVMLPVILWDMMWRSKTPWPRLLPKMALCALLAASGLLAFMAYLGIKFGHPFAFATGQAAWHDGSFVDRLLSAVTLAPLRRSHGGASVLFLIFLALTACSFLLLRFTVSLYALGTLLLPYLTLGISSSTNRFMLLCFPAFMVLGVLCKGRPWLASALIGLLAALLLRHTALFSQWYFVG